MREVEGGMASGVRWSEFADKHMHRWVTGTRKRGHCHTEPAMEGKEKQTRVWLVYNGPWDGAWPWLRRLLQQQPWAPQARAMAFAAEDAYRYYGYQI